MDVSHHSDMANLNVVEEVNNREIDNQDKDIEIERLMTTCQQLNQRVAINDDLMQQLETLKEQLSVNEKVRTL